MEDSYLKRCRRCGECTNIDTNPDFDTVQCGKCGHSEYYDDWERNCAREDALQAKVDALVELVKAFDSMARAEQAQDLAIAGAGDMYMSANAKIKAARAKCRALGLGV